jgi:hypothetical protein
MSERDARRREAGTLDASTLIAVANVLTARPGARRRKRAYGTKGPEPERRSATHENHD